MVPVSDDDRRQALVADLIIMAAEGDHVITRGRTLADGGYMAICQECSGSISIHAEGRNTRVFRIDNSGGMFSRCEGKGEKVHA